MKNKFKIIFMITFLFTILFTISVDASSYTSTINLGTGKHFSGSTRSYTAGVNKYSYNVTRFTKVDGYSYGGVYSNYIRMSS